MVYYTFLKNYRLKDKLKIRTWIDQTIQEEGHKKGSISVIFCSDEYLLEMNKTYLNHDYYTDIITFDYTENNKISGDLFISLDRIEENALAEGCSFEKELHRILIHGVLHLCGYKDKTKKEKAQMTQKEEYYLSKF